MEEQILSPKTPDIAESHEVKLIPGDYKKIVLKDLSPPPDEDSQLKAAPVLVSTDKSIFEQYIRLPYQRVTAAEIAWNAARERGPENGLGWACYFCLCGPIPGRQLASEEFPGLKIRQRRRSKKKRSKKHSLNLVVKEAPAQLAYREEAMKHLCKNGGGVERLTAIAFARHLGYIPSVADENRLAEISNGKLVTVSQFNDWVQTIYHPEDQDFENLITAFKSVDRANEGKISIYAFKTILTHAGESVPVDMALALAGKLGALQGNRIYYPEFVKQLLAENRHLPDSKSLGLDMPPNLPERPVTEAAHFAIMPWDSDDDDADEFYSSDDDGEEDSKGYVSMAHAAAFACQPRPTRNPRDLIR